MIRLITSLLLSLQTPNLVHSSINNHYQHGPITNVTKHLYFSDFHLNRTLPDMIKFLGSVNISEDKGFIQIPDASPAVDHRFRAGRAIYSSPIRLLDPFTLTPASFHTTFSFQLNDAAPAPAAGASVTGGGGLAFIIVSDEFTVGRPGPWLGILNDACDSHHKVFAVEFDAGHDRDFGDPDDNHVGIDLGSVVSVETAAASEAGLTLNDGSVHRAWITYDARRRWLDVRLGSEGRAPPAEAILSVPLNLSPFLDEYMFVGFSASTGNRAQIHTILSWNFSSTVEAALRVPSGRACRRNVLHQVSKLSRNPSAQAPSGFMIFVAVLGLCTMALLNLYYNGKFKKDISMGPIVPEKNQRPLPPGKARRYTMCEVHNATRRFSELQVLSSDSTGVLYRGTLKNGCHVAVKRFTTRFGPSSRLNRGRVLKIIGTLSRVCHSSLAPVRGWCCDDGETIVVYHYFQNGSLENWLFGLGVLPWTLRFKLIKEVAEALSYLHSKGLVHGNLRTSSVFIDMNYRAVLSDFGVDCTSGQHKSHAGQKWDVFGFGMLALEVIAGKKSLVMEIGGEDHMDLLGLASRLHERGETEELCDRRIGSCVNSEEATRVLEAALMCTSRESNDRPSMEEVVQFLNVQNSTPCMLSS